jgi:hypothetical protein
MNLDSMKCKIFNMVNNNWIIDLAYFLIFVALFGLLIFGQVNITILNLYVWVPFILYFYAYGCSLNFGAALDTTTLRFLFYLTVINVTYFVVL